MFYFSDSQKTIASQLEANAYEFAASWLRVNKNEWWNNYIINKRYVPLLCSGYSTFGSFTEESSWTDETVLYEASSALATLLSLGMAAVITAKKETTTNNILITLNSIVKF